MRTAESAAPAIIVSSYWSALYADYAAPLASFLRKLTGDPEVARELVQETFVRAIRTGREAEVRSGRAWLFRIAGNLARDHERRRHVLRFVPFTGREPDPTGIDPDADLVHRALRQLPTTLSRTLLLHYDAGFSRREIADMDGVTEEAVKARLARGRQAFAQAFERVGGDLR
ncbi:MAG: RNA polymerase sigma factor [Chloroflexi bacterium]|nr:RNA polymerase sigma factor [Chloroflexota bacterium]